ncbi:MAG: hypothetical protein QOH56_476 [Pseudonocardiales bacterium]|jgi:hypothetical protein|nr:hypothetical protein [Pseudonocardiales bacterium]
MDHSRAPVLQALQLFRDRGDTVLLARLPFHRDLLDVVNRAALDYRVSGVQSGTLIPDAAAARLDAIRLVAAG